MSQHLLQAFQVYRVTTRQDGYAFGCIEKKLYKET